MGLLPFPPGDAVIRKLQERQSYLEKAPYQRKSKKKAIGDAIMKLNPATWCGPTILKAHDIHEYNKDRKKTQEVYVESQERRKMSVSMVRTTMETTRETSVDGSLCASCRKESMGWRPANADPLELTDDPWSLPPISELASLGNSAG